MAERKSMLCVGGPLAGKRYAILHGSGFMVPELTKTSSQDPVSEHYQPNRAVEATFTNYRSETFHTPQGDISFWTPSDQTSLESIALLLDVYEQVTRNAARAEYAGPTDGGER